MGDQFKTIDRDTEYLFPPSVQEWLPEDHLARFIMEIVEGLNLERLNSSYRGSGSEANAIKCAKRKVTPYIACGRDDHNKSLEERFKQPPPLPDTPNPVATIKQRLKTLEGKKIYAKRKSTVEPVFGIIKQVLGFRQFLLRGLDAVEKEWNLVCMAWNIKRMHALKT
jgi:hypothetical protein